MKRKLAQITIYVVAALGICTTQIYANAKSASPVQTECLNPGTGIAKKQGGKLIKATPSVQDGREICVIVVIVPGRDGERPRRVEVAVPAK